MRTSRSKTIRNKHGVITFNLDNDVLGNDVLTINAHINSTQKDVILQESEWKQVQFLTIGATMESVPFFKLVDYLNFDYFSHQLRLYDAEKPGIIYLYV